MLFKRIIRLSLLVFALLLVFTQVGTKLERAQAQGPTIRIPLNYDPPSLDLLGTGWDQNATFMFNQIFENMFKYAPDGSIIPAGATSLDISPDGTVYTIHLRQNAKWSDGEFVVAKHYIDGILRLGGSELPFYFFPISGFEEWSEGTLDPEFVGIQAIDDYTIAITLDEPTPHFKHVLASEWIRYPVRLVNPSDPLGPILGDDVGNGPYQLVEWVPDDYITLVKNPNYWNSGNVEIENIQITIIPDLSSQLIAYMTNELDVSGIPGSEYPNILGDPLLSAELRSVPRPGVYFIGLNTALAPTDNIDFRRALATSIDRQYILDSVLNTPWRTKATGVIPPEMPAYQGAAVGFTFDLVAANNYLSNYTSVPSSITVELWYNTNNFLVVNTVAQMWESNLGIQVDLVESPWEEYLEQLNTCREEPANPGCTYIAYRLGWVVDYLDPWNILNDAFHPDSGSNYTHWDNAQYRNYLDLAKIEGDEATRTGYFQDAERVLVGEPSGVEGDVAVIPLYHYDRTLLIKSGINFEYPATGTAPYIMNWSFQAQTAFTVTSNEDPGSPGDGEITLREAINAANTNPGFDVIQFDIPGAGPHTIQPSTPLPIIYDPVLIDGYTQPGASPNTNPFDLGSNAGLKIEIDGTQAGFAHGLHVTAGNSTIRGLVINRFGGDGIRLDVSGGNVIEGNFIGTDVSGMIAMGNGENGIHIFKSPNNTIGGPDPSSRNIVSANGQTGVMIFSSPDPSQASGNVVQGNYIGIDASGNGPLGNGGFGVGDDGLRIENSESNTVGGPSPGEGNVISANDYNGVRIVLPGATGNVVQGNKIGTNAEGTNIMGNGTSGVEIQNASGNTIGGLNPGSPNIISGNRDGVTITGLLSTSNLIQGNFIGTNESETFLLGNSLHGIHLAFGPENTIQANTISFNGGDGIWVLLEYTTGNTITENSIHDNLRKGIENITGPNNDVPPPVITDMFGDRIEGTAPAGSIIEIFADVNGEGRTFLGTTTANDGTFSFDEPFSGPNLTTTATDLAGSTSEFSVPIQWVPDNCEANDSFASACDVGTALGFSMSSAGTFTSYLRNPMDVDWFYLDLPVSTTPGSQVTISLTGEDGGEQPANFDLVVFAVSVDDPDLNTIPAPLQGVPLQGVPLQGVPLQGVPLQGVDAEAVPLQGVPLQGVEVRDIPLQGVPLQGVPLQGVPLQGVPLQGVPLQGVGFHQGTQSEEVVSLFRTGMTGGYYVMVWSSTGEFSTSPYEVTVSTDEVTAEACTTGLSPGSVGLQINNPVGNPEDKETLIFVHTPRMVALYDAPSTNSLISKLEELAGHGLVNGVIVDLVDSPSVESTYDYWDANGCNPLAANLVTLEIKKEIHTLLETYPNIQNLVIVGNDLVIPLRRVPDEIVRTPDGATVPNEYDYQTSVDGTLRIGEVETVNSPTFATLRLQYYLSDDFYADLAPILLDHGHELSVPDMPIGRLIETPADISAYIQGFFDHDGLMDGIEGATISSFTTGHSFMEDQAEEIQILFTDKSFEPADALISDTWDRTDFLNAYFSESFDVAAINTHFDHWQLAPAAVEDAADLINSGELFPAESDLSGNLFFSIGCHVGLNFTDGDAVNASDPGILDFPQAFLSQGGTLIGNWGFGYGDDAALAYSEDLMLEFARRLGGSNLGTSLMEAKREYVLNQAVLDPVHEKILMEAIFYGLPMWEMDATVPPISEGVSWEPPDETTQGSLLVRTYEVAVDTDPAVLLEVSVPDRGSYFALAGRTQAALYRPLQPQASIDISGPPGDAAHGALFIGGSYHDINNFDPVITMPTWTHENPEPQFLYDGWDPIKIWSLAQLELGNGILEERLVLVPGQFLADEDATLSLGMTIGTQRIYESFEFEVFYTSKTAEFQPPIITDVSATVSPNPGITFRVMVEDPPDAGGFSSGIARVIITHTRVDGGSSWQIEELVETATGTWGGTFSITGPIDFFVQALDNSGNVGMFTPADYFTPVEAGIVGPSTVFLGQPVSYSASHSLEDPAVLWDFGDETWAAGIEPDEHAFSLPGPYVVVARLVDEDGNIAEVSRVVEVITDPAEMEILYTERLTDLNNYISDTGFLPDSAFTKNADNRRKTLLNKLSEIGALIEDGEINDALGKLKNDLLAKMDGCPTEADNNDWITDCAYQYELRDMIYDLIAALEIFGWNIN